MVVVALLVTAFVAVLGGFILGEYEFTGLMPFVAGILFGMVLAEIALSIARRRGRLLGIPVAVFGGVGILIAGVQDASGGAPISGLVWPSIALAVATAAWRCGAFERAASPSEPSAAIVDQNELEKS